MADLKTLIPRLNIDDLEGKTICKIVKGTDFLVLVFAEGFYIVTAETEYDYGNEYSILEDDGTISYSQLLNCGICSKEQIDTYTNECHLEREEKQRAWERQQYEQLKAKFE